MKTFFSLAGCCLSAGALALFACTTVRATDVSVSATVPVATDAVPRLPYGVEDILKLSRAKVGQDIVIAYVQNSGTIYNLKAQDIVYLKDQGVADSVVAAMLDQRRRAYDASAMQSAAAAQASAAAAQQQAAYANSAAAPVQTEVPAPASSLYVIPSYASGYYGYGGYPYDYPYYGYNYYRPYYGYYGPSFGFCGPTFSFGFGGRNHFGGHGFGGGGIRVGGSFHGGFSGGFRSSGGIHTSGGFHSGGGSHGGGHR